MKAKESSLMRTHSIVFFTALLLTPLASLHAADIFIVEDGKARAEIVISTTPTRMQRVAAH